MDLGVSVDRRGDRVATESEGRLLLLVVGWIAALTLRLEPCFCVQVCSGQLAKHHRWLGWEQVEVRWQHHGSGCRVGVGVGMSGLGVGVTDGGNTV